MRSFSSTHRGLLVSKRGLFLSMKASTLPPVTNILSLHSSLASRAMTTSWTSENGERVPGCTTPAELAIMLSISVRYLPTLSAPPPPIHDVFHFRVFSASARRFFAAYALYAVSGLMSHVISDFLPLHFRPSRVFDSRRCISQLRRTELPKAKHLTHFYQVLPGV